MGPREEKSQALIGKATAFKNTPWCDQYERMISGMMYNPFDHQLTEARFRARRLLSKYNSAPISDEMTPEYLKADRDAILSQLLGSVGSNVYLEPPIFVDYGCNISVGDNFYANFQ
ncbi:maltose acetyltransferase-domain-containing protein [Aspergillus alliaceus]|uniref:maltose acetyltransferase-domain-containing protein n=1 Tax=Petromyces alliaceus TaxID=209559 RepID=UPI0012A3C903|nr:maltose acetyltransferase-domain-containing protein [Aspergillus alliaceus]KAB8236704.1 maltose acetyltransferase-domain-containing protein [Aspergillus alliaceus]